MTVKNDGKKSNITETYLVFNTSGNALFRFLLKKEFSHVFVVRKHKRGWVIVDPCQRHLKTNIIDADYDLIGFYLRKGFHILQCWNRTNFNPRFIPRIMPILTCVTMAKYAVGKKIIAFTPWQLYKKLDGTLEYKR